jgi:large subunit ribosomal protein L4
MPQIDVYIQEANVVKTIELSDAVFGIEPNQQAIYDAVLVYQAGLRQGTHSTKTRAFVSGTGKKPFRQKGTGRARQGSTRATQWRGGAIAFGPHPRKYGIKLNRKVRRLALKSALSSKVADSKLIVLEDLNLDSIKTSVVAKALTAIGAGESSLIVLEGENKNAVLSARNIKDVKTAYVNTINVFDILKYDSFVATKAAVEKIEEVYK